MNVFEVCLLINYLMSKGGDKDKARARELADSLRDRNNPPSIDAMNRIYDVVLNMNSLNSKPSGLDGNLNDSLPTDFCWLFRSDRPNQERKGIAAEEAGIVV